MEACFITNWRITYANKNVTDYIIVYLKRFSSKKLHNAVINLCTPHFQRESTTKGEILHHTGDEFFDRKIKAKASIRIVNPWNSNTIKSYNREWVGV